MLHLCAHAVLALTRAVRCAHAGSQTGQDPQLGPDEAYPAWLWSLAEPRPALSELKRRYTASEAAAAHARSNAHADAPQPDGMDMEEGLRLVAMMRKADIKAANAASGKAA